MAEEGKRKCVKIVLICSGVELLSEINSEVLDRDETDEKMDQVS